MNQKVDRHFFRCLDCLDVIAVDCETKKNGYGGRVFNTYPAIRPECDCGGSLHYMGKVQQSRLVMTSIRCACDGRCTNAIGPSCDCSCGGVNHGSQKLVTVVTDGGAVPTLKPREDVQVRRARVAEFNTALQAAKDRIASKYGERYDDFQNGRYIAGELYWEIKEADAKRRKAALLQTHKGRINALAKVAA